VRDEPTTPEGRLIRRYRKRQSPEPTIPVLAERLGWSEGKTGAVERGHTSRNPDFRPDANDLAHVAAELRIPPIELDGIGRDDAAAILRAMTGAPAEPAPEAAPEILAALDALVSLLIRERERHGASPNDRATIEFIWDGTDGNLNPKPLADRVRDVIGWVDGPGRLAAVRAV
jgi:transcriptional regulator with XRE-family HTH domain